MHQKLGVKHIKQAMKKVVHHSADWHALCVLLAQKLCIEGDSEEGQKYAQKVDESKLADEYKVNFHSLKAGFAANEGEQEKAIDHLKTARDSDRTLCRPSQQFALTKQIARTYDSLGRLDDAVIQWEHLIEDLKNIEHSEHQPMLAYKFLSQTLLKMGKVKEAEAARLRWVDSCVEALLNSKKEDHFRSNDPPPNYHDELSDYFERCRQNVFSLYANQKTIVTDLKRRNAQFWVGTESMRAKMSDLLEANGKQHLSDKEQLPDFFFMRSISTYLTSVELAAGGRIPESYGALRMCLENSFYAFHLAEKPEHAETWLDRPTLGLAEIDAAKKTKRKAIADAFSPSKIINEIIAKSNDIGQECRFYYEMTIDEGAHPNVDVFRKQASQRTVDSTYVFGLDFLTPSLSPQCCKNVLSAAEVAIKVFRLAEWIW